MLLLQTLSAERRHDHAASELIPAPESAPARYWRVAMLCRSIGATLAPAEPAAPPLALSVGLDAGSLSEAIGKAFHAAQWRGLTVFAITHAAEIEP